MRSKFHISKLTPKKSGSNRNKIFLLSFLCGTLIGISCYFTYSTLKTNHEIHLSIDSPAEQQQLSFRQFKFAKQPESKVGKKVQLKNIERLTQEQEQREQKKREQAERMQRESLVRLAKQKQEVAIKPLNRDEKVKLLKKFIENDIIRKTGQKKNAKYLSELIVEKCLKEREDPLFIASLIFAESTFRTTARSSVGALGLMQIMPKTGQYIAKKSQQKWLGTSSLKDPQTNITLGIAYVKYLRNKFKGNIHKVLLAYNWGPGNVLKGRNPPHSTLLYSYKIQKNANLWRDKFKNRISSMENSSINAII